VLKAQETFLTLNRDSAPISPSPLLPGGGGEAAVAIEAGNVLDGNLPPKQLKMIQAWIEIHKEELMVDWELAVNGDEPFRIAPLQ
jgi:hypothetical protein